MERLHRQNAQRLLYIPWWYLLLAFALSYIVPKINYRFFPWFVAPLSDSVVVTFLSAVSTGMMALTALVFSLILLFITFGSTAYTPRLVSALAGAVLFHALGIFTGTFIYTLMALRAEGTRDVNGGSSALMLWVALVWLLASLFMLFRLVARTWTITITPVLVSITTTGQKEIQRIYPPFSTEMTEHQSRQTTMSSPPVQTIRYQGIPRYLLEFDTTQLTDLAHTADAVIHIPFAIGDSVLNNDALAFIYGATHIPEVKIRQAIMLGDGRGIENNPKYAIRLLVDIAIRALSPAVNDPTTAVQSLDMIESLLRALGNAFLEIGIVSDASGVVRLVYPTPTWEDYLALGILEIMQYGSSSVQVERRLGALFRTLPANVPEDRRPAITRLANEQHAVIKQALPDAAYRAESEMPDRQGLGHSWSE